MKFRRATRRTPVIFAVLPICVISFVPIVFLSSSLKALAQSCASGYEPPRLLSAPAANAPAIAVQYGVSGEVSVEVTLDDHGQQTAISVGKSPSALLNGAALGAIRAATFQAATQSCIPVPSDAEIVVSFTSAGTSTISLSTSNSLATPAPVPTNDPKSCEGEAIHKLAADAQKEAPFPGRGGIRDYIEVYQSNFVSHDSDVVNAVGRCYYARRQWDAARVSFLDAVRHTHVGDAIFESYWFLALSEERLRQKALAVKYIKLAAATEHFYADYDGCVTVGKATAHTFPDNRSFCIDYLRVNSREVASRRATDATTQRAYWDAASPGQRALMKSLGGARNSNVDAQPCSIERFDAARYHQETWWYGNCNSESEGYSRAYTFLNGVLNSVYTP